jgi:uncharacterized membrane protein HdeD (DUF308 family)
MKYRIARVLKSGSGAPIRWAVVMILLGVVTAILPLTPRITVSAVAAWAMFLSGLAYTISAIADRHAGALIWRLLIGLLYIAGGIGLAFCPQIALASLALAIASIITAQTILEIVTFFQARLYAGSIWALFDSGIKMLIALLLVFPWPSYTPWMVGLILGLNLMTTGFAVLIYSFYEPFEQAEVDRGRCL